MQSGKHAIKKMNNLWARIEWRITFIYAVFGGLWIFLSDRLLVLWVNDPQLQYRIQNYKGWFFVLVSAFLIYFTLANTLKRQREAETKRQESQERFQKLFETSLDAILLTAPDGRIYAANPAACRIFGHSEEEIQRVGRNGLVDLSDPRLAPALEQRNREGYFSGELTCLRKDGTKFPGEFSSVIFVDRKGQTRTHMLIRDITDRKVAENLLVKSRDRLNQVLESMTDAFILLDKNWRVVFINHEAARIHKKPAKECLGKDHWEEWPFTVGTRVEQMYRQVMEKRKAVHFDYHYHDEGQYDLWHEIHAYPYEDGIAIYYHDITDRKMAEQAMIEYNERLEMDVQARTQELRDAQETLLKQERQTTFGQLAGGVAHELRNPLGVIANAVYYLKLIAPQKEEKIMEYLGILERESQTAVQILSDLLNFSSVELGDRQPSEVAELIQAVLVKQPLPKRIELKLKLPKKIPLVFVDSHQVEQAMERLVVNAYEAMEGNGILGISVGSSKAQKQSFVSIAIQDNGSGIPHGNMEKIFEPLFTTKLRRIGLGLALSRRLVEVNGGRIEVKSKEGKGTTITLHLPVRLEEKG